ncbi:hypothetical protein FS749_007468 [Ceratobasidium sp. UAMH 11750]|nr:hypothetical protein FS749_007468 [Ceratobasidium sp. UAMH 11750]
MHFKRQVARVSTVRSLTRGLQSFSLYIDNITKSDANTIALSKALQSALVIRGAQLSIVRRLDTAQVASVHTSCISWIVKKIAGFEAMGNKSARNRAVAFFKSLLWLLGTVESADAIRIKNHLDVSLQDAKIETPASSKVWEPLRAYDKRLITAMAKDKALAARIKTGTKKKSGATTTDDEREPDEARATDDEREAPGEDEQEQEAPPPPPAPKPRARPRPKPKKPTTEDEGDVEIPDAGAESAPEPAPAEEPEGSRSPTPTPPETKAPKGKKPATRAAATKDKAAPNTRKRRRGAQEEEEEEAENEPEAEPGPGPEAPAPGSKPPSQAASDVGFTRRRKRAKA